MRIATARVRMLTARCALAPSSGAIEMSTRLAPARAMRWLAILFLAGCGNDECSPLGSFVFASDLEGEWVASSEVIDGAAFGIAEGERTAPEPIWWADAGAFIAAFDDDFTARFAFRVGTRFELDRSALPCAVLAEQDRPERERNALRVDWSVNGLAADAERWTGEPMEAFAIFWEEPRTDGVGGFERDDDGALRAVAVPAHYATLRAEGGVLILLLRFERMVP